jgi:hypothetical protein
MAQAITQIDKDICYRESAHHIGGPDGGASPSVERPKMVPMPVPTLAQVIESQNHADGEGVREQPGQCRKRFP